MGRHKKKRLPELGPGSLIAIYVRASSEDERQEGSTEVQEAHLRDWADRNGYQVVHTFIDRISAGTPVDKRPGFRAALRFLQENTGGIHAIACKRIDRAFRDVEVSIVAMNLLEGLNCNLVGADDPKTADGDHVANAKLIRTIQIAVAQQQREMTGEMVKDKQRIRIKQGLPHSGKAPFGYSQNPDGPGWIPDRSVYGGKSIDEWVVWMFQEALTPSGVIQDGQGNPATSLNFMGMACYLQFMGVPTPSKLAWIQRTDDERQTALKVRERNRNIWAQSADLKRRFRTAPYAEHWDSSELSDLLRSRVYLGEISYHDEWHLGQHPPLIDQATFDVVQQVLEKNAAAKRRRPTRRSDMLLAQMLTCGCGSMMTRHQSGEKKFFYACNLVKRSRGGACDNPRHREFRTHEAAHRLLVAGLNAKWEKIRLVVPDPPSVKAEEPNEYEDLIRERDRILRQHEKGWISEELAEEKLDSILARLSRIEQTKKTPAERARTEAEIEAILHTIERHWASVPFAEQRQVLKAYIPDGFRLYKHVMRAAVAGIQVETVVEQGETGYSDVIPGWAGTHEVARLLCKHENTITNWIKQRKIPAVQLPNGKYRVPEQAFVRVGNSYFLAPDAGERCEEVIKAFQQAQKIGTSRLCGERCLYRSGGIPIRRNTPTIDRWRRTA